MPRTINGGGGGRGSGGGGRGTGGRRGSRLNLRLTRQRRRRSQRNQAQQEDSSSANNNEAQESMDFQDDETAVEVNGMDNDAAEEVNEMDDDAAAEANATDASSDPSEQVAENLDPRVPHPSPPDIALAGAPSSPTSASESPPKSAPRSNKKQRAASGTVPLGGHGASTPIRSTKQVNGRSAGGVGGDDIAGLTDGISQMQTPSGASEQAMPPDGGNGGNGKRVRGGIKSRNRAHGDDDDDDDDDDDGVAIEREAIDVGQMRVPTVVTATTAETDSPASKTMDVSPPNLPRIGAGTTVELISKKDKMGILVEHDQISNRFGVWDSSKSVSFYSLADIEIEFIFGIGSSVMVDGKECVITKYHPTEAWAVAKVKADQDSDGHEENDELRFDIKPTRMDGDGQHHTRWDFPAELAGYGVGGECVHWVLIRAGATLETRADFTTEPDGIWSTCSLSEYDPESCKGTLFYHSTNLYEVGVDLCKIVYRIVSFDDIQGM